MCKRDVKLTFLTFLEPFMQAVTVGNLLGELEGRLAELLEKLDRMNYTKYVQRKWSCMINCQKRFVGPYRQLHTSGKT